EIYARRLNAVAAALEDTGPPLAASSRVVQHDIAERFTTETSPDGKPWQAWADSYVDRAIVENVGILHKTGALEQMATSTEAIMIRGDSVFYNTGALPHHGLAHDAGLPDRKNPLPQREFLGMSDESAALIFATFGEWFERSIQLFVTASGRLRARHSLQGPGGFVSRASRGLAPLSDLL
ncbi:MAG TPA: phage virion morphogenesis protein, partial [Nitrospira sp.]|nr:phage virion morphogenesis protein [Nitrospira sp.]